jgi:hypothetical protein
MSTNPLPVAFLTDVEGSLAKLTDFFRRHEAFASGADGRFHLRDGWAFVHGGDAPDRFLGSMGVIEELLRLKDEAPDRVVLIAGNRDVNKIRLPLELSDAALAHPPIERADDWQRFVAEDGARANTRTWRLRWIFKKTMGAGDAFELRRRELTERGVDASDDAVVASFVADLGPGGSFRRFLESACLMHRTGNTLFTHAGLTDENLRRVPGQAQAESVDDWVLRMNAWYRAQLSEWSAGLSAWPGRGPRPGEDLIRYCQPVPATGVNQASVVYSRNADAQGKIALPGASVVAWLATQGVRRLAVGHTPSGEVPVLLRTADDAFEMVVADTSRARMPELATLVTIGGGEQKATRVQAELELVGEGRRAVDFAASIGAPSPIGKRTADGALVVAALGEDVVTYQLKPGWKVEYRIRSKGEIAD